MLYQRIFIVFVLFTASYNVLGKEAENGKPAAATEAVQKASKQPKEKLICKRIKKKGSNIKKKICKTKAQMKYDVERSQNIMDKIHSSTSPSGN